MPFTCRHCHVCMVVCKWHGQQIGEVTDSSDVDRAWGRFSRQLGHNLQQARWAVGLSQERVAHEAGISTFTYQKLEKGESNPGTPANPRLQTVILIAKALGTPVIDLLPSFTVVLEDERHSARDAH